MLCFKNHGFLIRVIAGLGEPLYLAISVHISYIQVSGLFVCRRGIGQFDGNRLALPIGEGRFLAINQRELIDRSCSNRRFCLSGSDRCFGNPQNQIPALGLGIQHLQGIQCKSERGQAVCSNLKPAYLRRHQLVQRLCLDGDRKILCIRRVLDGNRYGNAVGGGSIFLRVSGGLVDCVLYGVAVNAGISIFIRCCRLGLAGGRDFRFGLIRTLYNRGAAGIAVIGRRTTTGGRATARGTAAGGTAPAATGIPAAIAASGITASVAPAGLGCGGQREGSCGLVVVRIGGFGRFDLDTAGASYRNLTVGIHCGGAADDLPGDGSGAGAAGKHQGKGVPVIDGGRCAGDREGRLCALRYSEGIGGGGFTAIADGDSFSAMPGNGQHRALGGIGGQLVGVPANGFAGVVAIAYLHRQAAQIQRFAVGVGQLGGLGLDGNAADLFFGGGNCHACANGFRIVGGGPHLCEEVVCGICGQAGEYFLCLPLTGGCVGGIHAVADCRAGVAGFYHSLIQSNLRGAVRLPGQRDLIRSRAYLHCKVLLYRVIVAATIFVVSSREGVLSYIANRSI